MMLGASIAIEEGTIIAIGEGTSVVALALRMSHSRNNSHSAGETKATFHFTIERETVVQLNLNYERISTSIQRCFTRLADKDLNVEFCTLLDPETSPFEFHTLLMDLEIPPSNIEGLKREIAFSAYEEIMEIPSKECEDGYTGTFDFSVAILILQHSRHPGEEEEEEEEFEALMTNDFEDEGFGRKPTARSSIDALEIKKFGGGDFSSPEICIICMNEYAAGVNITHLPCTHLFHGECIINWLENKNTCPLCRFEMPLEV